MKIGKEVNDLDNKLYHELYVNLWNVLGEKVLIDVWETVNKSIWDSVSSTVFSVCRRLIPNKS